MQKKGYTIIKTNWRSGHREIDIIAFKNNILAIIEVKTRAGKVFGFPEEAVNQRKQQLLKDAAAAFADANPQYINIRYDIISITMRGTDVAEIMHFEEAFY